MRATAILVADEAWVGLALLHRSRPERVGFSAREILERVKRERAHPALRSGVQAHIYVHNVANLPPNSARYRMFYRLPDGTFRLYRPGDDYHASRAGKTKPDRSELPARYRDLVDWYERDYCRRGVAENESRDPVLEMRGIGKEIWADEEGDAFVARERAGWEEARES